MKSIIEENLLQKASTSKVALYMYLKNSLQKLIFKTKQPFLNKFETIPLSAKTITDRITKISSNVTNQQVQDIKSAPAISVAVDKS